MENAPPRNIFGEISDFLASNPTPQEIINYKLPEDLQERAHELLDKNGEGELTSEEYLEMMDFARIENLLNLVKAKMKLKLKRDQG